MRKNRSKWLSILPFSLATVASHTGGSFNDQDIMTGWEKQNPLMGQVDGSAEGEINFAILRSPEFNIKGLY